MIHFMIDIETLGILSENVVIASIGICNSENDATLHMPISCLNSQLQTGRTIELATLLWHLKPQNYSAETFICAYPLRGALSELSKYIRAFKGENKEFNIWCKGASFDFKVLTHAYHTNELELPWNFRDEKDLRTALDLVKFDPQALPRLESEKAHTGLGDALYQMRVLMKCLEKLGSLKV